MKSPSTPQTCRNREKILEKSTLNFLRHMTIQSLWESLAFLFAISFLGGFLFPLFSKDLKRSAKRKSLLYFAGFSLFVPKKQGLEGQGKLWYAPNLRCCFALPSMRKFQGWFLSIFVDFLCLFEDNLVSTQQFLVDCSQALSSLVSFSQF